MAFAQACISYDSVAPLVFVLRIGELETFVAATAATDVFVRFNVPVDLSSVALAEVLLAHCVFNVG